MSGSSIDQVPVTSPAGPVLGRTVEGGVRRFLGIPYAEPPVGALRFARPQRRAAWAEPRDAGAYGPTSPQAEPPAGALGSLVPSVRIPGDDHLNLNVWAPADGEGHPVMVFVHGGSFTSGSGAIAGYGGARFARRGVVLVTINYRLGAEGFAWFGEGPANLGLLDQVTALEWVRDNIRDYGGDPDAVTVFGESAGGMSIGALLATPAAKGLFGRAIMQSGGTYHSITAAAARRVADRLAGALGVPASREGLAQVAPEDLVAAQAGLSGGLLKADEDGTNLMAFQPVVDGTTLPHRPIDAVRAGVADDVDLLLGWNAEEANLFTVPTGLRTGVPGVLALLARKGGLPVLAGTRAYSAAHPRGAAARALLGDWVYRIPAIRTAEAHPRARLYEFAWRSPAYDGRLGACHGVELPFVFDNLDSPDWAPLLGDTPPAELAEEVQNAWISFARTGDPGWAPYSTDRPTVRRFDTPSTTVRTPPPLLDVWAGRR